MAYSPNQESEGRAHDEEQVVGEDEPVVSPEEVSAVIAQVAESKQELSSDDSRAVEQIRNEAREMAEKQYQPIRDITSVAEASAVASGATLGANFDVLSSEGKAALMSGVTLETPHLAQGGDGGFGSDLDVELPKIENSAQNWINEHPDEVRKEQLARDDEGAHLNTLREQVRAELGQKSFFSRLRTLGLDSEDEWVNKMALKRLNDEKRQQ